MGLCVGPIRRDVSDPGRFIKGSFDAEAGLLWQGRALGVCEIRRVYFNPFNTGRLPDFVA